MKYLKFVAIAILIVCASSVKSQVSVNINLGSPPPWGPVGYSNVRYYYLPDIEAYYDIQSSMFIYYGGGVWNRRAHLPAQYGHYDLYNGYKVVLNQYHGNAPYAHFKDHKSKYAKGYHGAHQKTYKPKPVHGNSKPQYNSKNVKANSQHPSSQYSHSKSPQKSPVHNAKGQGNGGGKGHK